MTEPYCDLRCINSGCPQPSFLQEHETFLLTIIASISGCLGLSFTYFLKSRCSKIKLCWGILSCNRIPVPVADVASPVDINVELE